MAYGAIAPGVPVALLLRQNLGRFFSGSAVTRRPPLMTTTRTCTRLCIATLLVAAAGCASDPVAAATSSRTVAEVQPKMRAGMPLSELLSFTRGTPIVTSDGSTRLMLADGDVWIVEGRDKDGTVTVKEWKFEKG